MRLGIVAGVFAPDTLDSILDKIAAHGFDTVEIPTGNYGGTPCFDLDRVLTSRDLLRSLRFAIETRGLSICALSCQGNPLHPQKEVAVAHHRVMVRTLQLAAELGVGVVNVFSGCPGAHDGALFPHWAPCAWPPDFRQVLDWQWQKKLIPYWQGFTSEARKLGVRKLAIELHPGFMVYNSLTLLTLRHAIGPEIGANLDPSHLFWQGIDPCVAIRELGEEEAVFHFHAKDTFIDPIETARNGVFDTRPYDQIADRSWFFRMPGYGHSPDTWNRIFFELRRIGYEGAISVEHEDALFSREEGITRAVAFLKDKLFRDPRPESIWWGK